MMFTVSDDSPSARSDYSGKIRISPELHFKYPQSVTLIHLTNQRPKQFRTDLGDNWFSGI